MSHPHVKSPISMNCLVNPLNWGERGMGSLEKTLMLGKTEGKGDGGGKG